MLAMTDNLGVKMLVRPSGWLSADSSRRRIGSLPKQKSLIGNVPASAKDDMLSNSVMRTNSSARRAVGSSSCDAEFAGSEADTSRPGIGNPTLHKVTSGHQSSPVVLSEHPCTYSGIVPSNELLLESTIGQNENLNVNNQERRGQVFQATRKKQLGFWVDQQCHEYKF